MDQGLVSNQIGSPKLVPTSTGCRVENLVAVLKVFDSYNPVCRSQNLLIKVGGGMNNQTMLIGMHKYLFIYYLLFFSTYFSSISL